MSDIAKMLEAASEVLRKSYSPYSRFPVGACIRTTSGQLFAGCNVENASFSLTLCAEAAAIGSMVSAGQQHIKEVLVMGGGAELCTPCGACRQRLREFAMPDTPVYICDINGIRKTMTMAELLPESFGPQNLEKKNDTICD